MINFSLLVAVVSRALMAFFVALHSNQRPAHTSARHSRRNQADFVRRTLRQSIFRVEKNKSRKSLDSITYK